MSKVDTGNQSEVIQFVTDNTCIKLPISKFSIHNNKENEKRIKTFLDRIPSSKRPENRYSSSKLEKCWFTRRVKVQDNIRYRVLVRY